MKVENPRFAESGLDCQDCPFTDKYGAVRSCFSVGAEFDKVNFRCGDGCPTTENYATACELAEEAAKGGKG